MAAVSASKAARGRDAEAAAANTSILVAACESAAGAAADYTRGLSHRLGCEPDRG